MPSYVRAGIRKCARIRALSDAMLSDFNSFDEFSKAAMLGKEHEHVDFGLEVKRRLCMAGHVRIPLVEQGGAANVAWLHVP